MTLAEIAHRDPVLRRQRHCQILRGKTNHNAAWYYPDPEPAASVIKGRVAFWKGVTIER